MPIHYHPESLEAEIEHTSISSIAVLASPPEEIRISSHSGQPTLTQKRNQWEMALEAVPEWPVFLTLAANGENVLDIIISRRGERKGVAKSINLIAAEDLTAGNIIRLIRKNKHDCYRLSTEKQGHRHWMKSTIALLFSAGYVTDELQVEEAKKALQAVWEQPDKAVDDDDQTEMVIGTFFDPHEKV